MAHSGSRFASITARQHFLITSAPPFVSLLLQAAALPARQFPRVVRLAEAIPNDPRLIEMVRQAGDASAKVPYLLAEGETARSILEGLREIVQPHAAGLHRLAEPVRATVELLLSLNAVPDGCEAYTIPALLEIDRIQREVVKGLHFLMAGRGWAAEFLQANTAALRELDEDWPRRVEAERREATGLRPAPDLPEDAHMRYKPFADQAGRLVDVSEICVIVDPPQAARLRSLTPPILRRPLPEEVPAPAVGSPDWLLREVGKVGRHFTRALLGLIRAQLEAENIEAGDFRRVNRAAVEALREYIEDTP